MTLVDLLTSCALDAAHHPAPQHACVVWLLHPSSGGAEATRTTFLPKGGRRIPIARWVDILVPALGTGRALLGPDPTSDKVRLPGFLPIVAGLPTVPIGLVALLPSLCVPVLEAAFETGPAIEMPWLRHPDNLGLGQRTLARERSIAATLLHVAQRAARARLN